MGGAGQDDLDGGTGKDRASYATGANQEVAIDLATNTVDNDGQGFAETIGGVEDVRGAPGEPNTIIGNDADNVLIGGTRADELFGGAGPDLIRGEDGADTFDGGDGADTLFPGLRDNEVDGGDGADTLNYTGLGVAAGVTVIAGDGDGTATVPGLVDDVIANIESVTGTPNADNIQVDWNGVASFVQGRAGVDNLSTVDGDTLDAVNGRSRRRLLQQRRPRHRDQLLSAPLFHAVAGDR